MQKKKSLFPLVFAVLTAFALLIGMLDVFVYAKYIKGGRLYKLRHPVEKVDMTDPDGSTDYGRIYYSPIEEEHIVEYEDASGCGYIDNEVLVVANNGVSREQIAELAVKYDAEIVGEIEVSGDYQLRLTTAPDELDSIVESISAEPVVDSAEINYITPISGDSTGDVGDFYYGKEWQKEITSSAYNRNTALCWGFREINTPMAWYALSTNEEYVEPVNVGLLDCGFSDVHPDLGFKQFFYDNGDRGMTSKKVLNIIGRDHGTNVSGIFAANANDDTGVCGVYPYGNGRLYGVYVDGAEEYDEEGGDFYTSSMCEMVSFAELIVRNVKVINMSMGFNYKSNFCEYIPGVSVYDVDKLKRYFSEESPDLRRNKRNASILGGFFDRMLKKGYDFVICASAGNDSLEETGHLEAKYNSLICLIDGNEYPDVYDRIIVVGALGRDLQITDFSNAGDRTDIFAPGGEIYSTRSSKTYGEMSGTSQASPHVAGVAAMVWSACNSLTGAEVKQIIIDSAETSRTSVKMLNAFNAVIEAFNHVSFPIEYQMSPTDSAIVGKVVKSINTYQPIFGATVTATSRTTHNTYSTETDKGGQFEFVLPMDTYDLTVEKTGYEPYQSSSENPIELGQNDVYRCKVIKLKKDKIKSSGGGSGKTETTTVSAKETPVAGKIYTGEDIKKFLPDKFGSFDIGIGLDKIRAWTYYNGHFYAIFDHAMSAKVMSLATRQNSDVHLVTITSEEEQTLIEELMLYGERDVYYTGGMVDKDGDVYTINDEDTDYTHWYEGCPDSYGKEDKDDIIAIYRGTIEDPKSSPDYGYWFDLNEDEYNVFDFVDLNVDGATRGIIIEWDKAITEEATE